MSVTYICSDKMGSQGLGYCTAREDIVLATVCGQDVKFSCCNSIPSKPSCLCRTLFLIQVTVLGFSYLCATRRSQIFYRAGLGQKSPEIITFLKCFVKKLFCPVYVFLITPGTYCSMLEECKSPEGFTSLCTIEEYTQFHPSHSLPGTCNLITRGFTQSI